MNDLSSERPPWLAKHWQCLWQAQRKGRLGHAWLLTGRPGLGKRCFAEHLTQALLCPHSAEDGTPCGACQDCRLLRSGNHPDVQRVVSEAETALGEIKVDAIRRVVELENLTAHRGRYKVIHIDPAEAMNRAAANSLLKTLEEPTDLSVLLLIADDATQLPATIRSRCQQLIFLPPPQHQALPWLRERLKQPPVSIELLLRLAEGAPLRALELAQPEFLSAREQGLNQVLAVAQGRQDPLAAAAAWQALDPQLMVKLYLSWLCDLARLQADPQVVFLGNPDQRATLLPLARRLPGAALHAVLQQALHAQTLLHSSANKPLLLESLMIRWAMLTQNAPQTVG